MPPERMDPGSPAEWLQRARSSYALACAAKPEETCWEDLCFQAQQQAGTVLEWADKIIEDDGERET